MKLRMLVDSLALQQIKEVGLITRQEDIMQSIECTCKIQWYTYTRFITYRPIAFCHSTITKAKTVQRTLVLQCS